AAWRAMWEMAGGPQAAAGFEERAAEALAAWRDKRFELPDYYLVVAGAEPDGTGPDLYLGPLRAARPRRGPGGAPAPPPAPAARPAGPGGLLHRVGSRRPGPGWPPLD